MTSKQQRQSDIDFLKEIAGEKGIRINDKQGFRAWQIIKADVEGRIERGEIDKANYGQEWLDRAKEYFGA